MEVNHRRHPHLINPPLRVRACVRVRVRVRSCFHGRETCSEERLRLEESSSVRRQPGVFTSCLYDTNKPIPMQKKRFIL